MLALTATASPANRKKIMKSICFKSDNAVILDNPDRENMNISVIPIPNNVDDEKLFHWMMKGIMKEKLGLERHLIFCASIKDCSRLYCMFSRLLGNTCIWTLWRKSILMILLLNTTMAFNVADSKDLYANYCIDLYNLLVLKKIKICNIGIHIIFWGAFWAY